MKICHDATHQRFAQTARLMIGMHRNIRDLKTKPSVSDNASHPHHFARMSYEDTKDRSRQSRSSGLDAARRHAGINPKLAERHRVRHFFEQAVLVVHSHLLCQDRNRFADAATAASSSCVLLSMIAKVLTLGTKATWWAAKRTARGYRTETSIALGLLGAAITANEAYKAKQRATAMCGKIVVVMGGSRGLGLEIARQFGLGGGHLVLVSRNEEELRNALGKLQAEGAIPMALQPTLSSQTSPGRKTASAPSQAQWNASVAWMC